MIFGIQGVCRAFIPRLYSPICNQVNRAFQRSLHAIRPVGFENVAAITVQRKTLLSLIETSQHHQICGLKYLVNVHRRCKDCYLMYIEGVVHNFCTAHPRHKQKMITKRPKNTWILTGVTTQTKLRKR